MLNTPKTSVNLYLDYPKHIYCITNNDGTPEIRIRLKIHRLLKQSSMK